MSKQNNKSFNPVNIKSAREHRPLRWLVRQFFTEEYEGEFYRQEVWAGYNCVLDKMPGMPSSLSQALNNIRRFGGELYADYADSKGPILVENYN